MIISALLVMLYLLVLLGLALYGFNALIMSGLFLWHWPRLKKSTPPPTPAEWPSVTVQLPIFNERLVIERLIDAVAGLDYPRDRLFIQVLDDSTDETRALARVRVASHAAQGVNISYIQRPDRVGFKAGALAFGLTCTASGFIAIFDADFVPPPDFLRQVMPHFADPHVGMVQTRWGHLNAEATPFTRAQAIALDGHFIIEQTARSQSGLLLNFNGSGGVWRRAAIDSAGGWQADTICEDFDLSYRAQLAGWKLSYVPDVVAPAEIPPTLTAYKRQQFRWAKGSIQCLGKLGGRLLAARLSIWHKVQALLHMGGYSGGCFCHFQIRNVHGQKFMFAIAAHFGTSPDAGDDFAWPAGHTNPKCGRAASGRVGRGRLCPADVICPGTVGHLPGLEASFCLFSFPGAVERRRGLKQFVGRF